MHPYYEQFWRRIMAALGRLRDALTDLEHLARSAPRGSLGLVGAAWLRDAMAGDALPALANTPHVEVARGRLRDGPGGPVVPGFALRGVARAILAHLRLNGTVHTLDVIALQSKDGLGTLPQRKRHVQTTMAKVRAALRRLGLSIVKPDGRRGDVWSLAPGRVAVTFSVDDAKSVLARAGDELAKGKPREALQLAIEALTLDALVQEAHELLCRAAVRADARDGDVIARVAKSVYVLEVRAVKLGRALEIARNSLATEDDEAVRADLEIQAEKSTIERERVQKLIAETTEHFGPFGQGSPKDRAANDAIAEIRRMNLTFEQAWQHPLFGTILAHPSVGWLLDEIVRRTRTGYVDEPAVLRERMKAEVLVLVLNPTKPPNIRWIRRAIKHDILKIREPGREPTPPDVKKYLEAVDAIVKERGFPPSLGTPEDEELLQQCTGLSLAQLKAAVEWLMSHRREELGADDRRKHKKRRSDGSYGDDGDDQDDDEGDDQCDDDVDDNDDDDEGLAGMCVLRP
jgi:hypothetical protein